MNYGCVDGQAPPLFYSEKYYALDTLCIIIYA